MNGLISAATLINYFLILGGTFALSTILAKLFIRADPRTIKIVGIDLPLNHAWAAMALLTLAHAYFSWSLLVEIESVLSCSKADVSLTAWKNLTSEDAVKLPIMFHMAERHPIHWSRQGPVQIVLRVFSNPFAVNLRDTLLGMHILLVAGVFAASVRWFRTTWRLRILTTLLGLLLVIANWFVGSQWALLASDLLRTGRGDSREMISLANFVASNSDAQCTVSGREH